MAHLPIAARSRFIRLYFTSAEPKIQWRRGLCHAQQCGNDCQP